MDGEMKLTVLAVSKNPPDHMADITLKEKRYFNVILMWYSYL